MNKTEKTSINPLERLTAASGTIADFLAELKTIQQELKLSIAPSAKAPTEGLAALHELVGHTIFAHDFEDRIQAIHNLAEYLFGSILVQQEAGLSSELLLNNLVEGLESLYQAFETVLLKKDSLEVVELYSIIHQIALLLGDKGATSPIGVKLEDWQKYIPTEDPSLPEDKMESSASNKKIPDHVERLKKARKLRLEKAKREELTSKELLTIEFEELREKLQPNTSPYNIVTFLFDHSDNPKGYTVREIAGHFFRKENRDQETPSISEEKFSNPYRVAMVSSTGSISKLRSEDGLLGFRIIKTNPTEQVARYRLLHETQEGPEETVQDQEVKPAVATVVEQALTGVSANPEGQRREAAQTQKERMFQLLDELGLDPKATPARTIAALIEVSPRQLTAREIAERIFAQLTAEEQVSVTLERLIIRVTNDFAPSQTNSSIRKRGLMDEGGFEGMRIVRNEETSPLRYHIELIESAPDESDDVPSPPSPAPTTPEESPATPAETPSFRLNEQQREQVKSLFLEKIRQVIEDPKSNRHYHQKEYRSIDSCIVWEVFLRSLKDVIGSWHIDATSKTNGTLAKLKKLEPALRVVVEEVIAAYNQNPANDYLIQPLDSEEEIPSVWKIAQKSGKSSGQKKTPRSQERKPTQEKDLKSMYKGSMTFSLSLLLGGQKINLATILSHYGVSDATAQDERWYNTILVPELRQFIDASSLFRLNTTIINGSGSQILQLADLETEARFPNIKEFLAQVNPTQEPGQANTIEMPNFAEAIGSFVNLRIKPLFKYLGSDELKANFDKNFSPQFRIRAERAIPSDAATFVRQQLFWLLAQAYHYEKLHQDQPSILQEAGLKPEDIEIMRKLFNLFSENGEENSSNGSARSLKNLAILLCTDKNVFNSFVPAEYRDNTKANKQK